jgi:hypothetical protein
MYCPPRPSQNDVARTSLCVSSPILEKLSASETYVNANNVKHFDWINHVFLSILCVYCMYSRCICCEEELIVYILCWPVLWTGESGVSFKLLFYGLNTTCLRSDYEPFIKYPTYYARSDWLWRVLYNCPQHAQNFSMASCQRVFYKRNRKLVRCAVPVQL